MKMHEAIEAIMASDAGERAQCVCSRLVGDDEVCPFCFGATTVIGRSPKGVRERARLVLRLAEA
jgi:serine kinase of HPr protein (carbohydrate metabolism regulator)